MVSFVSFVRRGKLHIGVVEFIGVNPYDICSSITRFQYRVTGINIRRDGERKRERERILDSYVSDLWSWNFSVRRFIRVRGKIEQVPERGII